MATKEITSPEDRITYIRPKTGWSALNLRELWLYRELIFFMTWRDLKVRYKQTALGASWAVLRPFLSMVVFSIFFGNLAKVPSDNIPYPIFSYSGLLPWELFAVALGVAARSLVTNSNMITKIYFPRCLLPASAVLGNLFDLIVMLPIVVAACLWFGFVPHAGSLFWVPFYILTITLLAFGSSTLLATLNALYRDIRHLVPFLLQFGLFLSPIGYGVASVPEAMRPLYCLNPLVGLFEGLRIAFLGTPDLMPSWALPWSIAFTLASVLSGLAVLLFSERRVVDVI